MQITWIADTLHSVYRVPCNMEGEPEYNFTFKTGPFIKFTYEVRDCGTLKSIHWTS